MNPVIIESMTRIESPLLAGLALLCAAVAVVQTVRVSLVRARAYRLGAQAGAPTVRRDRDIAEAKLEAAMATIRQQRVEIADLKAVNARLRGAAADIARRCTDMAAASEEPTEGELHLLRVAGRKR